MTLHSRDKAKHFPHFLAADVPYQCVKIADGFWAPRQDVTRDVSVGWVTAAHDRAGGIEAIRRSEHGYTAKTQLGEMEHIKFIEAMATIVGREPDPDIVRLIEAWAEPLLKNQAPDGYLAENFPLGFSRPPTRWEVPRGWLSHEDYTIGHYIEAAITYKEATGSEVLLESAIRAANNMADTLLGSPTQYVPGHPEIEQALMRLYEATSDQRYVQLCGLLLDQRGHSEGRPSYGRTFQDHLPVAEQRTIEGHAVCAAYLFNGATLYSGATGHKGYRDAAIAAWDDLVANKLFIHGGSGNLSARNEGYLHQPQIAPNDCYGESCAAIANFRWAHSLFALTAESHYLDVAERILYNVIPSSLSLSGDGSFYTNGLQTGLPSSPYGAIQLTTAELRQKVRFSELATSCCPPNVVKLINSLGGYFYSTDERGIVVKHYGSSAAEIPFGPGVAISQETHYPWSGDVSMVVSPATPTRFSLRLRVPAWATACEVRINGVGEDVEPRDGWIELAREWHPADAVQLHLGMAVERVTMPEGSIGYENRAALQRGPVVYCLEEQDLELETPFDFKASLAPSLIYSVYIPETEEFRAEWRPDFLGGVTVLAGAVTRIGLRVGEEESRLQAVFVPYAVWGNRAPSPMRVWLGERSAPLQVFLAQQDVLFEACGDDWK